MNKVLTICIPTYKRPITLKHCIDSIVSQVEKYGLASSIDICVVNDASPDNTSEVIAEYEYLDYFSAVNREYNLGMNINIKLMLSEVSKKSEYQLIVTDDDYLQPDVLDEIVTFLSKRREKNSKEAAIWTPRYSYTETGGLHCVVCDTFNESRNIEPSIANSSKYMLNGFVLSGLIIRASHIDYKFWETYDTNAFFPMIFVGDLIMKDGAYFWRKNIVHHTVLNKCHWERWGNNDLLIELKLLSDSLNSYTILATKINNFFFKINFYQKACTSIVSIIRNFMASENLKYEKSAIYESISEQKAQGVFSVKITLKLLILYALFVNSTVALFKLTAIRFLTFVSRENVKKTYYLERISYYIGFLQNIPTILRLI